MSTARLDRLTSLRFIAAFVLFGFHGTAFFEGPTRDVMDGIFGQGRAGVSFFFILSGFVLAWSSRTNDTPAEFYRRRFARIYPAYLAALALGHLELADRVCAALGLPPASAKAYAGGRLPLSPGYYIRHATDRQYHRARNLAKRILRGGQRPLTG